jgi:hypothetical protein
MITQNRENNIKQKTLVELNMAHKKTIINLLNNFFKNNNVKIINNIQELNLDIFKLYYADYTIFLTGKFFKKSNCFYNFKKNLLSYFDKYNILYFNFEDKDKIIYFINLINFFIKNSSDEEKEKLIVELTIANNTNKKKNNSNFYFNLTQKIKELFFSENIFEPNILYKKIKFSSQVLFISFDNYVIKKMEYKLRTFCQIAEKLGAEKISIEYNSCFNKETNINLNVNAIISSIGTNIKNYSNDDEKITIVFEYPNNHSDINLNKFYLIDSILNENEFLITKEEFEADLELKFLLDARCINFIQKYNTIFIMNHINKVEQKIIMKAYDYGLSIDNLNSENKYTKISITIDFLQIHNNNNIIDGTNIHILREGFIYLANIIKSDNNYLKLLRFLQSHLNAIEKKYIFLEYNFDNIDKINKIYNNIIHKNFEEYEICKILQDFFKNNITWHNFKKFRNIILNGSDDKIEKLYFITFQYHDIMNNKKHIMYEIDKILDIQIKNFILLHNNKDNENLLNIEKQNYEKYNDTKNNDIDENSFYKSKIIYISNNNIDTKILNEFLIKNKISIKNILYICFKKSFRFQDGLSDNINNSESLKNVCINILNYYYNNDIKNLQNLLNQINLNDFNIKENLFYFLIENISNQIIQNIGNTMLIESSPNINNIDHKITLIERVQKIFIKFITRYFNYENKIDKLINKLNSENKKNSINYINNINNIDNINKNSLNNCAQYSSEQMFQRLGEFNTSNTSLDNYSALYDENLNDLENINKDKKKNIISIDRNRSLSHSDSIELENKNKYNKNENYDQYLLNDFINDYILIHKIYKNYNKYKLFYTWDDFLNIINYFSE